MVIFRNADSDLDFEGILALQRRNLRRNLSADQQNAEGFVYLEHDVELLKAMAAALPQAIAVSGGEVVGYCLALACELRLRVPRLEPLFQQLDKCEFRGKTLAGLRYFVGGQVCVDKAYRGRGLAADLYRYIARSLSAPFDLCVTEIAARNRNSLKSHFSCGFCEIQAHHDADEDWIVVAWDLK